MKDLNIVCQTFLPVSPAEPDTKREFPDGRAPGTRRAPGASRADGARRARLLGSRPPPGPQPPQTPEEPPGQGGHWTVWYALHYTALDYTRLCYTTLGCT